MSSFGIKHLCTPSYVYLVISVVFLILSMMQNYGNTDQYCLGYKSCAVPNTSIIFVIKFLYVLFWTWMLNLMCKAGATPVAWFLVILPIVLMFVMISLLMI